MFQADGIRAFPISGQTDTDERRERLAAFERGEVDVLTNCMVLTEGTDLPRAACILHAKPTKSATMYAQITGRGLRLFPGKTSCIVIDLADLARRHSLLTAGVLYGLPPGLKAKGQSLEALESELETLRGKMPDVDALLETQRFSLEELRNRASTFDVFRVPDLGEVVSVVAMNWIRLGADSFRVSYPWGDGTETLHVQPDVLGKYTVALTLRVQMPRDPNHRWPSAAPASVRQRTLITDLATPIEALKLAESFVEQERRSVLKLKDRAAPWRARPASPKQIDYLRKLRVPFDPNALTMGKASDLIDMANARKGR